MFGIIQAIKSFFEFIISAVGFVLKIIKDMVYAVKILGETILKVPTYIGFLPSTLIALFGLCLSIVVVYKVLGRD